MKNNKISNQTYLERDFVKFSPVEASITLNGSEPGLALDSTMHAALGRVFEGKDETSGMSAIFLIGFEWGMRECEKIKNLALATFDDIDEIEKLDIGRFQILFSEYMSKLGWGQIELTKKDASLYVELRNPVSYEVPGMQEMVDSSVDLYAGFFSGVYSLVSGLKLSSLMLPATSKEPCITFLLDNENIIQAIKQKVDEGSTAEVAILQLKQVG